MQSDNHIHTHYCPHGSDHIMEDYVKSAIRKGIKRITFTEHAPLVIEDTTPEKDSAMALENVEAYINEGRMLKKKYLADIEINLGFEVDYIEGKEMETVRFLQKYPEMIPYSILSVHFIKLSKDDYFCIDYDKESFLVKIEEVGYEKVTAIYEHTLNLALSRPFKEYTPKTIGHITLIDKFKNSYPFENQIDWSGILKKIKSNGYHMDYNFAGLDKPYYKETYPPEHLVKKAVELGIPLSYGSDAHHPDDVGRYFERSVENG
ncbi:MAG: histidinol-phosphatase HisJ [Alkalibacterium sp.]|nr:histidinol-phosphatase HisJ [Alkalibacterium sp.]